MSPWLLHYPPVTMYGTCIVAGLILAWLLARRLAARAGREPSHMDLLVPLLIAAGLGGAYAFGQLTDLLTDTPAHGTVLVGSLLCATLAGIVYALIARIPLGVMGDICAGPLALGMAVGRVGCFFAGCCYGKPTGWAGFGVRFPARSFAWFDQVRQGLISPAARWTLAVHPVQLYESALCVGLAILLSWAITKPRIPGERFLLLGIGYSVGRFGLEFLRADNPAVAFSLTFSQLFCVGIFVLALATLIVRRRFANRLGLGSSSASSTPAGRLPASFSGDSV